MILLEGREAYYNGNKVIILEKVNSKLVKVAKKSNPRMILHVSRKELAPAWIDNLIDWIIAHI